MKTMKIGTRLSIIYTAILMLLMLLMSLLVYFFFATVSYENAREKIIEDALSVADEVDWEDGRLYFDLEEDDLEDILREGLVSVYTADGQRVESNHETQWLENLPYEPGRVRKVDEGLPWQVYDKDLREDGEVIARLRIALPTEDVEQNLAQLRLMFCAGIPICLILSILSGLILSKRVLAPINKITEAAREIGQGDLSQRLEFPNQNDEIGRLASTFDDMLDNLQEAFAREKRFTSDASHELRTPIAVIMAYAEEALGGKNNSEVSYRESLQVILNKSRDMQRMLSQLLMLARGNEQAQRLEKMPLDISRSIEDIAEEMRERAETKKISIHLALEPGLLMEADLMLFTRLMMNLIQNAIQYGYPGGHIWLSAHRAYGGLSSKANAESIIISVADDGCGIAPENLEHIFERFYREDCARSGEGFGLGLSIVRWIVHLHQGEIEVESELDKGTKFNIAFPSKAKELS